jgi:hypothetical protein
VIVMILLELAVLLGLAANWFGGRTSPERFGSAYDIAINDAALPSVRGVLHRTYLGRVLGGLCGLVLLGGTALLLGVGPAIAGAFVGLVAGTMVGIALAQLRRRADVGSLRHASLDARTVADYAPPHAMRSEAFAAALCIAVPILVVTSAPAGLGPYTPMLVVAAAAVVLAPVGNWLQRRIVEAPRADIAAPVDDALRTAAVRAVHHSVLGVLLCGLVVAGVAGLLTQSNLSVRIDGRTWFTAPPGSTSISVDTGRRLVATPNTGPLRITWTEADGSDHEIEWARVTGHPAYGTASSSGPTPLFGLAVFLGTIAVFVQWGRATSAWKRGPKRHVVSPVPVATAGSST